MQLSCCFNALLSIVVKFIYGPEDVADLEAIVPSGCVAPVCDVTLETSPTVGTTPTVGGGASLIIAVPVAVVMSLLLALVAIL